MMKHLVILLILFVCTDAVAQQPINFTNLLKDGLYNNYDIKLKDVALRKSESTLYTVQGSLLPYFTFSVGKGVGKVPDLSQQGTNYLETQYVNPTISGIDIYAGTRLENTSMLDATYYNGSGVWAGARIPLLRGLGSRSLLSTSIQASEIGKKIAEQELSNEVLVYTKDMLSAYLSFNRYHEQITLWQMSSREAMEYQGFIYELIEQDEIPRVEKSRADVLVAQQDQEQTNARILALNAYYRLLMLVGISQTSTIKEIPSIKETIPDPDPEVIRKFINDHSSINDQLLMNTPLYRTLELSLEESRINLLYAENQKKNELDLNVRLSHFGVYTEEQNFHFINTLRSAFPGSSASLSLTYTLPLKNQRQEGAYLQQLEMYNASKTNLDQLKFELRTQSQNALAALDQLLQFYADIQELVEIRKKAYDDEEEKYRLGNATQIDVILSFENYYQAQSNLIDLKFQIFDTLVEIKYLLGLMPRHLGQLENSDLNNFLIQ